MLRVGGPPIESDRCVVPGAVLLLLAAIVAGLAQRLPVGLIPHEGIVSPLVWHLVIDHLTRAQHTTVEAHHAQWIALPVMEGSPVPVARVASLARGGPAMAIATGHPLKTYRRLRLWQCAHVQ
jgi:hypothetical protein